MYYSHTAIPPILAQTEMRARNGYVLKTFQLRATALTQVMQGLLVPIPIDWQLPVPHNPGGHHSEARSGNNFRLTCTNNGSYRPTERHARQRWFEQ